MSLEMIRIKFTYHDGGMHLYSKKIEPHLVLISTKLFVNDVVIAASKFVQACQNDRTLKERVESRLPEVLQVVPRCIAYPPLGAWVFSKEN